ncbi:hypothetical protein QFZ87_001111 [Bacillus sp. SLBN-46]|uniref:hypothetical protein n=1 Tax=Bacillus sp. SLBN-46 TaxID=3042283 RepID=UPI00285D7556|nr:hypothetical protein [Bacillus sp. SLBN-46]MDR6121514.1 hypothetical protein [Bacillus sp. SLBN-46]
MVHQLTIQWHKWRYHYFHRISQDCLDSNLKQQIIEKAKYHQERLLRCYES